MYTYIYIWIWIHNIFLHMYRWTNVNVFAAPNIIVYNVC